jgi:Tannase and feruloyl esterase
VLKLDEYVPTDNFFGAPYIDKDEERDAPITHRYLHGGFEGTDTRFVFYFPLDGSYQGRMVNPLGGAHGGHEESFGVAPMSEMMGGLKMAARLGAYMIESNQGHIGDDIDPKGGDDPTLYGHRASAEVARFSKFVAEQVYGQPPHHSYVWGGSGGGRRSPLCLENAPDAWDGALPFVGGGPIVEPGSTDKIKGAQTMSFASMFNCQRILGDKISTIADAMAPGGHGDPFVGLDTHQREELAMLYKLGFPRGDEYMISQPMGQMWLWTSMADSLEEQDPSYFEDFWTRPGYVGHDHPELVARDVIDTRSTVARVLTPKDILEDPMFLEPEYQNMRIMVGIMAGSHNAFNLPMAVELDDVGAGYRLGSGVRIVSGRATGRQLYAMQAVGNVFFCDGVAEANLLRFTDVLPGDEVHVDNRKFLAYHYFARHHLMEDMQFDALRVDGKPIYPQHPVPLQSALMGVGYSGQYKGKLMWVHHTKDSSLWPPQGVVYRDAVLRSQGEEGARERFRLRWVENAEHGPAMMVPSLPNRAAATWLIDYMPFIEQSLVDLIAWVEQGVEPVDTAFGWSDNKVILSPDAVERRGIQAVIRVTANGSDRAEVRVGDPVTLEMIATVPPGAGTIVAADWDFDGTATFPYKHGEVDGTASSIGLGTSHAFDRPGEYFVTGRVHSHREGDVTAEDRRIPNVAQARVVVR